MPKREARRVVEQPLDDSIRYVGLTQNQFAIIDAADAELTATIPWLAVWKAHGHVFYVSGYVGRNKYIYLHNFLMQPPKGYYVDHINRNPLDNRRCNLRIVTHAENCQNRGIRRDNKTGHIGVFRWKSGKWGAMIERNNVRRHLGSFATFEEACAARRAAEV